MSGFKATLDTKAFDKSLQEYLKFQKRLPADVINAKLFFIARGATLTTKHADPNKIEAQLRGNSSTHPSVPMAGIIVNAKLGKQGKKGLTGDKMARAIEKLVKARKKSVNFVRAGWKQAIKILENYLRASGEMRYVRRSSSPTDPATLRKSVPPEFGTATPARADGSSPRVYGEIANNIHGDSGPLLDEVKKEGLQQAINKEARSMNEYIEKKINAEHSKK